MATERNSKERGLLLFSVWMGVLFAVLGVSWGLAIQSGVILFDPGRVRGTGDARAACHPHRLEGGARGAFLKRMPEEWLQIPRSAQRFLFNEQNETRTVQ